MAVTIYDGQLPTYPNRSDWVAVPASRCYSFSDSSGGAVLELSLDGQSTIDPASRLENLAPQGGGPGRGYRLIDVPVSYVRIWFNGGGTPPAGKVTVVAV